MPSSGSAGGRGSSVPDALSAAIEAFRAAGIPDPETDAEVMLSELAEVGRADLVAFPDRTIEGPLARAFSEAVRRRLRREPVAYILGTKGFRNVDLAVDRRVLIPRPETEMLVELALEIGPSEVLEIGTGSGAVAIAVADELPGCRVTATDISIGALQVAEANAGSVGVDDRVVFIEGTWPGEGEYDLILANLPYVPAGTRLEPELTEWEPASALFGGPDGIEVIAEVLARMPGSGIRARAIGLEIGHDQGGAVADLVSDAGFGEVEVRRDFAGHDRVVVGRHLGERGLG